MSEEAKTLLYLVVRSDLKPGLQAAQIAHVAVEVGLRQSQAIQAWHSGSQTVVCLAAKDMAHLAQLASETAARGLQVTEFHEPDLGGELTVIAVLGERLFSSLPLALRGVLPSRPWEPSSTTSTSPSGQGANGTTSPTASSGVIVDSPA